MDFTLKQNTVLVMSSSRISCTYASAQVTITKKIGENADGSAIYEDEPSATYAFLNDGCIAGDYAWYSQKSTGDRTDWTSNVKTYVNDQFNLQLQANSGSYSRSSKLKYSCEMILCPLEAF